MRKKRFGIETLHREIYNNRFQLVVTRTNGFAMFFQEAVSASHLGRSCFALWSLGFFAAPGEFGIFFSGRCSNKSMPEPQIAKARGVPTFHIGGSL